MFYLKLPSGITTSYHSHNQISLLASSYKDIIKVYILKINLNGCVDEGQSMKQQSE
jgi:hypothetical protein